MRYDHDSMLPERAFRSLGGRMTLEGGGKGSSPPPPDYTGAAQAQATSSKETTNMANYANRPDINTPFGGQSWTTEKVVDPATGQEVTKWTQNTTVAPEAQAALDSQLAMQQGRSDLANSLMPQAEAAITTPIDYDSFSAMGAAPTASNFQAAATGPEFQTLGSAPTSQTVGSADPMQRSFSAAQGMPGQFAYTDTYTPFSTNSGPIQTQLDLSNVSKLSDFDRAFVGDMFNQTMDYMRPDQERMQSSLETKLVNQGLSRGSEAYNNAYRQMMDQQSRDKYNALQTAYNQGNQMYQNQLAANNQTYNQALNTGNFANSAQGQQFNQANQAWNNNFNMQNQQFNNQNAAWNNNFNLGNTSFNQAQALANFGNNARQQDFANQVAATGFNNQAAQTDFGNQNTIAGFNNQAAQNAYNNAQAAATFNNQNRQNEFAQQQNIANYQNVLRQQQIAEAQQRQLQPLNNINALVTGQQVGMPQMPSFNANQAAQPVNYLGAAQAQGNYNMQQQQMNNASANSAMSGAFGLGGSLLGAAGAAGGFAPLFAMSDKRLKTNIKKIMDIKVNGKTLGWYRYNYLGSDEVYEGVMAQEVEKVKPEAVKRHSSGYRMVNYAELGV